MNERYGRSRDELRRISADCKAIELSSKQSLRKLITSSTIAAVSAVIYPPSVLIMGTLPINEGRKLINMHEELGKLRLETALIIARLQKDDGSEADHSLQEETI